MRYSKSLAGCVAVLSVVLLSFAHVSAAVVTNVSVGLRLVDTDGNLIPQNGGGVYQLSPGQTFEAILSATVNSPSTTDTFRSAANNGKPLGLQSLVVNINSTGSVGQVVPSGDAGSPPTWHNFQDLTPNTSGGSFINLIDNDSDGDLDVNGAGMAITTTSLASGASASALANVQVGVGGNDLNEGEYTITSNPGIYSLNAALLAAVIYTDPANTAGDSTALKAALQAVDVTGSSSGVTIQLQVAGVPEPTSIGLVALSSLTLLGIRRRKA